MVLSLQRLPLPTLCPALPPPPQEKGPGQCGSRARQGSIFLYPQQEPEGGSCQPGTAENTGAMTTSHQPQDRYKAVWLIFFVLGLGTLLPWNFFMTATKVRLEWGSGTRLQRTCSLGFQGLVLCLWAQRGTEVPTLNLCKPHSISQTAWTCPRMCPRTLINHAKAPRPWLTPQWPCQPGVLSVPSSTMS